MEENRKLYPMAFTPDCRPRGWGGETFLIADLGEKDSEVANGWLAGSTLSDVMETYLERVVGETSFDFYGTQFPVAVRQIDVRKGARLSLRLNPDDTVAAERYDCLGKTALWYVAEAGEDATVWIGFRKEVTAEEFYRRCLDGTLEVILHAVKPKAGDVFMIPPGTVHAAEGPLRLFEISESSDLFFRLHDWGAGKELHLEEAFDLIGFGGFDRTLVRHTAGGKESSEKLAECPQFAATLFRLGDPVHVFQEEADSFLLYTCIAGEALIQVPAEAAGASTKEVRLRAGESVLVPEEVEDFFLMPAAQGTRLLEVLMPHRSEADTYTGEAADVEPLED